MRAPKRLKLTMLRTLIHQLAEYGLDPGEWQLSERDVHANEIRIRHRLDANFQMGGGFEIESPTRACWRSLYVVSI